MAAHSAGHSVFAADIILHFYIAVGAIVAATAVAATIASWMLD